jgi:hypothetical protein
MSSESQTRFCRIEQSLGREEACPEGACPFWSAGVEERQGHCSLDRVDLRGRGEFSEWLHAVRRSLMDRESDPGRAEFYRRLNEGRSD